MENNALLNESLGEEAHGKFDTVPTQEYHVTQETVSLGLTSRILKLDVLLSNATSNSSSWSATSCFH